MPIKKMFMFELHNVYKAFDAQDVLKNIHLTIPSAQITCLIGPSGCGKTTLLKLLNRLLEPSRGSIRYQGDDIQNYDPVNMRRSMGYVIQNVGLLPHFSVLDNVALLEKIEGKEPQEYQQRACELLETVNLPSQVYANRLPRQLSGGQQQRVGIARALMANPPVLLMDEPFGALDPITRRELQKELKHLNQHLHKTIVMVTHDLQEAFRLGDQVVLMKDGEIVQAGSENDFIKTPANAYVQTFLETQLG